ncbi:MAG: hypothetical protein NTY77_06335 [Elusimicrobia bacterium]|nr:hypothetical protein [Elusimicrobiota bacterium]
MDKPGNSEWERVTTLDGARSFDLLGSVFHPGGKLLASTRYNITTLRAVPSGDIIGEIKVKSGFFSSYQVVISFSPCGKLLAMGCPDKSVKLWAVPDGKLLATLTGHESRVRGLAFTDDGKHILSFGEEEILAWELQSGRLLQRVATKGTITAYSLGGKRSLLAVGYKSSWTSPVNLYSAPSLEHLNTIEEPCGRVNAVAVHPDGNLLGFGDSTCAKIWDLKSNRLIGEHYHRGQAWQVCWIKNATMLASCASRRGWGCPAVHIMDTHSGETVGSFNWPEACAATGVGECAGKLIVAKEDGTRYSLSIPSFKRCGTISHPSRSPQTVVSSKWCVTTGDSAKSGQWGQTTIFWRP